MDDVLETLNGSTEEEAQKATVKMKLRSFMRDDKDKKDPKSAKLMRLINQLVENMNRVLAEAYTFANFHILRLLTSQNPNIPAVNRKFFYRCLVAVSESITRAGTLGVDMVDSIRAFDALRPSGQAKVNVVGMSQVLADLSIVMATMASNHLWVNVWKRLFEYVKKAYPKLKGKVNPKVIVDAVLITPTTKTKLSIKDDGLRAQVEAIISDLRSLCPLTKRIPSKPSGNSQGHKLLPLLYHIMRFYDDGVQTERAVTKRHFNLLPMKNGFTPSYIPISTMTLNTILKSHNMETFSGDGRDIDKRVFWTKYFNLNAVETRNRIFGCRICTDGYAVSIIMDHQTSIVCPKSTNDIIRSIPPNTMIVGIDPGFSDVVTTSRRRLGGVEEPSTHSYSSRQYYQDSKIFMSNKKTDRWNKQLEHLTKSIPTSRTCSWSRFTLFTRMYLKAVRVLLDHRMHTGYRNMRFVRYVHKQKTVKQICDMIAPPGEPLVAVGFGDWKSSNSPVSRRTCGPIEDIKMELRMRSNVVFLDIDEYKTSITCHYCHEPTKNMRAKSYNHRTKKVNDFVSKVHKVLHCTNRSCRPQRAGHTWNRDTNASLNILALTMLMLAGHPRPSVFERSRR